MMEKLSSVQQIIDYLEKKGSNHNFYYHYTTWASLEKIIQNRSFLFTRGNALSMNDQHEPQKGSWDIWNRTYVGSFSFGSAENMAMWGLYGLPWEDAIRLEIPKKEMLQWVEGIDHVTLWNGKTPGPICNCTVTLADIIYIDGKKGNTNIRLSHADKHWSIANEPNLYGIASEPEMTGFIKNYAWHYENEVRLKVELVHDTGYEKIKVDVPDQVIRSIKVTTGPYFMWKNSELLEQFSDENRVTPSGFTNLLNYKSICSMCTHEQFERIEP